MAKKVAMKSVSVQEESECDQNSLVHYRRSGLKLNWEHDEDAQHLGERNAA